MYVTGYDGMYVTTGTAIFPTRRIPIVLGLPFLNVVCINVLNVGLPYKRRLAIFIGTCKAPKTLASARSNDACLRSRQPRMNAWMVAAARR